MAPKTYPQLRAELAELEARIQEAREREKQDAMTEIHRLMDTYGIQHKELMRGWGTRGKYRKQALQPRYRDPATGETRSGRGNPPLWLRDKDRELYLIPATGPSGKWEPVSPRETDENR